MLSSNVVDSFSIPFLKIIIRAAHRIVLSELQATVIEKVTQTLISCTFYKTSHFTLIPVTIFSVADILYLLSVLITQ